MSRQRFLCIVPVDPEAFLRRQTPLKRRLMRANVALVGAPVAIAQVALPLPLGEVALPLPLGEVALPLPLGEVVAAMRAYAPPGSTDRVSEE